MESDKKEKNIDSKVDETISDHKGKYPQDGKFQRKADAYAENTSRVSKDNLFMIIALWLEDFDGAVPNGYNKIGAVLVLPNDIICAADWSRDEVHAVVRLLMKNHDRAVGAKVYMSRKPCPICAKLLVQSKVQRVLFLPREPEYRPNETNDKSANSCITKMKQVDYMFNASTIALTQFVLQLDEPALNVVRKKSPSSENENVKRKLNELMCKYSEFVESSERKLLPWSTFDETIKGKVCEYFKAFMEWVSRVLVMPQSQKRPESARGLDFKFKVVGSLSDDVFNPVNQPDQAKQAKVFIEIARFMAARTDDPTSGVGALIVSQKMEILAFGWNGYPLKARYGEFARASKDSEDTKFPYLIHAEQNALLMRNGKNVEGAILFVTKVPCDECSPLLAMEGIKTFVVDDDVNLEGQSDTNKGDITYKDFPNKVTSGVFRCYQTEKSSKDTDVKGIPATGRVIKEI